MSGRRGRTAAQPHRHVRTAPAGTGAVQRTSKPVRQAKEATVSNSTYTAPGHPGDQHDVTLYRRAGVLVTRRWLVVNSQRYPIRDLRNLRTAQGDRRPISTGT